MADITIEFVGGFLDGRTVSTDAADPQEASAARAYLFLTDSGAVGKRFMLASDAAIESLQAGNRPARATGHIYEVVERREEQGRVVVRVHFVGLNK